MLIVDVGRPEKWSGPFRTARAMRFPAAQRGRRRKPSVMMKMLMARRMKNTETQKNALLCMRFE
jgi:hypothetical protein